MMTDNNVADLTAALAAASVRLDEAVRRLAPKHIGGEMEEYYAALKGFLGAERDLAKAEQRPYAVASECPLSWDVGAPLPTLLQHDYQTFLFFLLSDDEGVGQIEFEGCQATTFGSPGDETFEGHSLHGSGFEPYRAMEVMNSPWITQLRKVDSVHPRHDPATYKSARHFIFPFHDTTFECVARSFKAAIASGPLSEAVKSAVGHLY